MRREAWMRADLKSKGFDSSLPCAPIVIQSGVEACSVAAQGVLLEGQLPAWRRPAEGNSSIELRILSGSRVCQYQVLLLSF